MVFNLMMVLTQVLVFLSPGLRNVIEQKTYFVWRWKKWLSANHERTVLILFYCQRENKRRFWGPRMKGLWCEESIP